MLRLRTRTAQHGPCWVRLHPLGRTFARSVQRRTLFHGRVVFHRADAARFAPPFTCRQTLGRRRPRERSRGARSVPRGSEHLLSATWADAREADFCVSRPLCVSPSGVLPDRLARRRSVVRFHGGDKVTASPRPRQAALVIFAVSGGSHPVGCDGCDGCDGDPRAVPTHVSPMAEGVARFPGARGPFVFGKPALRTLGPFSKLGPLLFFS